MKRFRWFSLLLLVGIQGIFSTPGGGAEPSRTLAVTSAQEKIERVAIVIGNSNYPSGMLVNPKNDATAMAASLRKLGFDVELKLDASKADMDAVFKRFSGKADKASVAALFYAGHGIQVNGSNYLVPLDASPRSERDLKREMIKMDDVIDDMGNSTVKLVFFDACRDNPLSRSFSRGGSRGMAAPVEATGTLISFATKHGNTAADGDGRHSPYTAALLTALENPSGVEIEQLLRKVQQSVKQKTGGQQEPWRYGSLDGDFYFKAPDPASDMVKVQQNVVDKAVFEAVKRANEQAAREKAELRQSMEKMVQEVLARQNAAIEAERKAQQAANRKPSVVVPPPQQPGQATAPPIEKPIELASIAPTTVGSVKPAEQAIAGMSSAAGDEWEYVSRDAFGKQQKVTARVKAVVAGAGILETYSVDGKDIGEWVFDGKPSMLGIPIDAALLFSPHWTGDEIEKLVALNGSNCGREWNCGFSVKILGNEKITVPAGSFETKKLEVWVSVRASNFYVNLAALKMVVWYSMDQKRLIKQTVNGRHPYLMSAFNKIDETTELAVFRSGAR